MACHESFLGHRYREVYFDKLAHKSPPLPLIAQMHEMQRPQDQRLSDSEQPFLAGVIVIQQRYIAY